MALQKLLDNGIACGLFDVKAIGNLCKSPSKDVRTEAIDYDLVKEKMTKTVNASSEFGIDQPKSCDALKIISEANIVDFIELKGFEQFKQRDRIQDPTDPRIQQTIAKFDLDTKIEASCNLFFQILHVSKLGLSKAERKTINALPKNYLVVVDIDVKQHPEQVFAASLEFLSQPAVDGAIVRQLQDKLDSITYVTRVNKPILLGVDDLDEYYEVIVSEYQVI